MSLLLKFIMSIILTEASTEVVVKSELFNPIRKLIFINKDRTTFNNWLNKLIECGYCSSMWAGMLYSSLLLRDIHIVNNYLDWFLIAVVLHRLSNILHNTIDAVHNFNGQG